MQQRKFSIPVTIFNVLFKTLYITKLHLTLAIMIIGSPTNTVFNQYLQMLGTVTQ